MEVVLVFLVCDGNVAVRGVKGVRWCAFRFYWWYKLNMRAKGILLIAHGNARIAMLPSSEVRLEFDHISDALLVDSH